MKIMVTEKTKLGYQFRGKILLGTQTTGDTDLIKSYRSTSIIYKNLMVQGRYLRANHDTISADIQIGLHHFTLWKVD